MVFYDGVNDTTSALLAGEAGLTTNEVNRRKEFNLSQSPSRLAATLAGRLLRDSGSYRFAQSVRRRFQSGGPAPKTSVSSESVPDLADAVVRTYEANVALVESLGRSYGFRPIFFWQPIVFTKPVRVALEEAEVARYSWTQRMFAEVYARTRESATLRADPSFHDISRMFAGTETLVFIDYCHTTETANALIAAAITQRVIEARASGRPMPPRPAPSVAGPAR